MVSPLYPSSFSISEWDRRIPAAGSSAHTAGTLSLLRLFRVDHFILIMEDSQQSGFSTPRRSAMVAAIFARP